MKKIIAFVLAAVMMLSLVACGGSSVQTEKPEEKPAEEPKTEAPAEKPEEAPAATEAEYKLGMGVALNTASSTTENAQVDATVATVVLDADGKIVLCRIDCVQDKMNVAGGAVDTAKEFQTKMELGDAYGMAGKVDNNDDGVMLEWYDQVYAFEAYAVGKTGDEIGAMETQEAKGHMIAVDEALLTAGCTIQITDLVEAVVKACKDEKGQTFKTADTFTLGVAATSTAAESTPAVDAEDGSVKMYSDFGAAVVGSDGKILASLNDATQPKIAINKAGEIVSADYQGTKRELGEGYGMAGKVDNNGDGVMLEWDAQSAAFSAYAVGKTAAELRAMETQEANGHHIAVDEALLTAGCTIQISGMVEAIARAADYAR